MNMQAMLKQAQAMQKDMMKVKNEIDNTEFTGSSSLVTAKVMGDKTVSSIEFNLDDDFSIEDIDMLQDMIVVAINDAMKKVDETTEKKMSKFGNIPGLF